MLAAKVCHHTLQTPRAASRTDSNGFRQQTHIRLLLRPPDPFLHIHQTKYAPPLQSFFLRIWADSSFCFNCSTNFLSACVAQLPRLLLPKRLISSIRSPSTSSALFSGPFPLLVISKMLLKRSISSGCSRSCSIRCNSSALNVNCVGCLSFIPTVNNQVAKFVHFILHLFLLFSLPAFNHTQCLKTLPAG